MALNPLPVLKADDDNVGITAAQDPGGWTVGTAISLNGTLSQMPHVGTIAIRVNDNDGGQELEFSVDIVGYNADGIRVTERVDIGPITEANIQVFQTAGCFSWIESITPTRVVSAEASDTVSFGWNFATGEGNTGGGLSLPMAVTGDSQWKAYSVAPSGTVLALVTPLKATDYDRRVWYPSVLATALYYHVRFMPSVE
jgi:hypothetical protein